MFWNIFKVFQFIAVANNNCIHVNKGEIWILVWQLQGKISHALRGAESSTLQWLLLWQNSRFQNVLLIITSEENCTITFQLLQCAS